RADRGAVSAALRRPWLPPVEGRPDRRQHLRDPGRAGLNAGQVPDGRPTRVAGWGAPGEGPVPRALYHSIRIGAQVIRAMPRAMTGRPDRLPAVCGGVVESPGWPGTRRSRGLALFRRRTVALVLPGNGAAFFVIRADHERSR